MRQTTQRRSRQKRHNDEHGITPRTIQKPLPVMGQEVADLLAGAAGRASGGGRRLVGKAPGKKGLEGLAQKFALGAGMWNTSDSVLDNVSQPDWVEDSEDIRIESGDDVSRIVEKLEKEMRAAAARLDFERAASIRDRIIQLQSTTN